MASKIKVDQIEGSTGSTITIPTGQTFTVTDGIPVASGGTGLASFTAGDILYATGATTLTKLGKGTAEQVLAMNTGATAPDWGSVDLTVLPTITVAKGGTNLSSFTAGDILYATGATTLAKLAKGGASEQLAMNSGATAPEWVTAASGGLVQLKQNVQTVTQSITGDSSTWVDATNLSVDITPAATGNKILVLANINLGGTMGYGIMMRLVRDSTPIYVTTDPATNQKEASWSAILTNSAGGGNTMIWNINQTFLDNPSTTSATTYKIQWLGEATETYYINRRENDGTNSYSSKATSSITVMEIASGAL